MLNAVDRSLGGLPKALLAKEMKESVIHHSRRRSRLGRRLVQRKRRRISPPLDHYCVGIGQQ